VNGVRACPGEGLKEICPCSRVERCCGCRGVCVGGSERDGPIANRYAIMGGLYINEQ
jgi:hypothetical protein